MGDAHMILGLHHAQITVPPGAEALARRFYCGVLGLPEVEKPASLRGRGGLWVRAGDHEVHIGTEDGVDRTRTKAHLAYEVSDLAPWREIMAREGITVLDSVPIEGFDRFEARDPFGNRIEFIRRLA
jgi:catechol 2,3-dioxygenase-like lactoylglutathione lyase family enzyme